MTLRVKLRRYLVSILIQHGFVHEDIANAFHVNTATITRDIQLSYGYLDDTTKVAIALLVPFYSELIELHKKTRNLENHNRNLERKLNTCKKHRRRYLITKQVKELMKRNQRLEFRLKTWQERSAGLELALTKKYEDMMSDWQENATKYKLMKIDRLELSVRTHNALIRYGIETIPELLTKSNGEIQAIRNIGNKAYGELMTKLSQYCSFHIND